MSTKRSVGRPKSEFARIQKLISVREDLLKRIEETNAGFNLSKFVEFELLKIVSQER
jgi:hypothetical protein